MNNSANTIDKTYYVKLSMPQKLGFSGMELGNNFSWIYITSFLMVYLTDTLLIPAGMVSLMFLICRFWDAVNDPLIGMLSDRTRSRWGRYRPYVMFGTVPLFLLTVILFYPNMNWSVSGRFAYVFIVYVLLVACYTAVSLSVGSLNAAVTQDPAERGTISTYRMCAGFAGGTIVMVLVSYLEPVISSRTNNLGYFIIAAVLAVFAIPMHYFGAKMQKEVVPPSKKKKIPLPVLLKWSFKNPEFIKLSVMFFFMGISWYGMLTVEYYWFIYVVGNGQLYGLANIVGIIPCVAGLVITPWLAGKMKGKGSVVILAYALYGFFNFISYFYFRHNMNIPLVMVSLLLVTLFMIIAQSMLYGMIPDTVEYTELISDGIRMDGFINTLVSFWNKIGITIGTALTGWILEISGYNPLLETQTSTVLNAMDLLRWMMPALSSLLIILVCLTYKIDYARFNEIVSMLQKKKTLE